MTAISSPSSVGTINTPGGVTRRFARVAAAARGLLVIAVVVGATIALARNWAQVQVSVWQLSWSNLAPSLVLALTGIFCATASWQTAVNALGPPIDRRVSGQVFLVGQLGKYLPGSVWAYVLQLELGRRVGLSRTRCLAASVLSTAIALVAALVAAGAALPALALRVPGLTPLLWLYLLLPMALMLLQPRVLRTVVRRGFVTLRREPPAMALSAGDVFRAFLWALGSYVCFGLHLWSLAAAYPGSGADAMSLCIGTMAAGMLAGLFFFLLPSGMGVREAVIMAALSPVVGTSSAFVVAAVSRVLLTGADLATAGGAALLVRLSARPDQPLDR